MQVGMTSPACCSLNGYLYIAGMVIHWWSVLLAAQNLVVEGGAVLTEADSVDLVMRYNPRTSEWGNDIAPMRIARSGSAVVVLRRKIYVCGMLSSSNERQREEHAFHRWFTIEYWKYQYGWSLRSKHESMATDCSDARTSLPARSSRCEWENLCLWRPGWSPR